MLRRNRPAVVAVVLSVAFASVSLAAPHSSEAAELLGTKPAHLWGGPSTPPNNQAISTMIWAPGIDAGYVPQGVASAGGSILVSAYRSTDPKTDKGPCRVFRVDARTGASSGHFDLPDDCGHAGGAVSLGNGVLVVSDTRRLYKVDTNRAFRDGDTRSALLGSVKLSGALKGSFVGSDGKSLFIGSSEKEADKANGFFLPLSVFETHNGKTIAEDMASKRFPIAPRAQGAAFDRAGNLWLTASSSKFGELLKMDADSGAVLARYNMVIGIEDLSFDEDGQLWSVSEAGSVRWSKWSASFPVVFRIDTSKLK